MTFKMCKRGILIPNFRYFLQNNEDKSQRIGSCQAFFAKSIFLPGFGKILSIPGLTRNLESLITYDLKYNLWGLFLFTMFHFPFLTVFSPVELGFHLEKNVGEIWHRGLLGCHASPKKPTLNRNGFGTFLGHFLMTSLFSTNPCKQDF